MNLLYPLTTVSFGMPLLLLAGPLVLAIILLRPARTAAFSVPATGGLAAAGRSARTLLMPALLRAFAVIAVASLSIAAARPQKVHFAPKIEESRNIMLSIDVSPSMGTDDFSSGFTRMTRLGAVKRVVQSFIERRKSDRIGLVVFGGEAALLAPLTPDRSLIRTLVERLEVGSVGEGTAIGDGLGLALKRVRGLKGDSSAVILLTDGVSNAGQVSPLRAAQVARDLGIRVHTVGVGGIADEIVTLPGGVRSARSKRATEFDEQTLREIAEKSGGVYFNASDFQGLERVYREIDKLERSEGAGGPKYMYEELYVPFALTGFLALAIYFVLSQYLYLKIP